MRLRASFLLLLSLTLGCGDCLKASDFVDVIEDPDQFILEPDMPSDMPVVPDQDQGVDPVDDFGDPKDLFNFDFGPDDFGEPQRFELRAVVPSSGPVEGGTSVRIEGSGLEDGAQVFFASQGVEASLSGNELVVRTPPGNGPGPVSVKVVNPNGESQVLVDAFRYVEDLRIDQITPSRVPTNGGTLVEIRGSGFQENAAVSFGSEAALGTIYLSDGLIQAYAPPQGAGLVDLRVTTPEDSAVAVDAVEYFQPLELVEIDPASGSEVGGELVTLKVLGMDASLQVLFDGRGAPVQNINIAQQAVQVLTPPGVGLADITLLTDSDAAVARDAFYYRPDDSPTIAAISPASGPISGGNQAQVLGWGFLGRDIYVDGNPAVYLNRTDAWALIELPAGASLGQVDVTLLESASVLDTLPNGYTYLADLEISTSTPESGPVEGGTEIVVQGEGLSGVTRVTIGGISTEFQVISDTELRIVSPPGRAGPADIKVSASDLEAELVDGFEYTETLEIWGFSPTRGSVAGNTLVNVRGRGFSGQIEVTLGGNPGAQIRRLDRNNLTFRAPPGPVGPANLEVGANGATTQGPYTYTYFNPASQFGGASGGVIDGSVNVTVYSSGGGPLENAFVMLSTRAETPYQGFTDVNGMVTLSGPEVLGAQTVTATAAGYSTVTVQTVDAENITVFLNLLNPPPNPGGGAPPPFATIRGNVTADGKLSVPDDQAIYEMAVVATTQRAVFAGNPSAGPNAIVLGEGAYEIRSRIGDLAVVALCGTFNSNTQEFTPQLAAVERFIFLSDQDIREVDLLCNIPLDETLTFKLVNTEYAPTGPDNNAMEVFWDFGFEGVFRSPTRGRSLSTIVEVQRQPELSGVLEDISFIALGGSYTGLGTPFSRVIQENITPNGQMVILPALLSVPQPVSPQPGTRVQDNMIRFRANQVYPPDFTYLTLRNSLGIPVWEWIIPAGEERAVIPEFPSFSGLPPAERPSPLVQEPLFLSIFAVKLKGGFDYERFTFRDVSQEVWRAYSVNNWSVILPLP